MKFFPFILAMTLALVSAGHAFGDMGHDHASAASFRINGVSVTLSVDPAYYEPGKTPTVSVMLSDTMSGSAVYDADILVKLEKTAATMPGGHRMPQTEAVAPSGSGLDFGGTMDMSATAGQVDLSGFVKLQPSQMAGMYGAEYPLADKGEYAFTLAVKSLSGRTFAEPLLYGGTLSYQEQSRAPLYRMFFVISCILLSGVLGIWFVSQRRTLKLEPGQKLNLLDIPRVRHFLRSAWFQPVFQIPVLVFFLVIIGAGIFDLQQGDRNIATLLMWTIWWAAIIFTFVFVGRVWCMMCPFGAVQDWIGRFRSMNRDFPRPLRNVYLSSLIFFSLTWWDSYSGIVNRPALTAYLLLGFFGVAMTMAAVFKGRSFCRYVCPIGGLIGIYSMFSPLELRSKCLDVCRGHKVKECIVGTPDSHGCPMFVTPMTLDRNNYCNFCSECIKSCSQDNIVIRFRSFAKDLWVSSKGYLDEALLAMALVGITIVVTGEMVEPWHRWMDAVGAYLPLDQLGIISHAAREKATFLVVFTLSALVIAPSLLLMASLIVRKLTGPDSPLSLKRTFIQFAYMFIPVGLSMHLAHNLNHLLKEGPWIVPAAERLTQLVAGVGSPDWTIVPVMGNEAISWLQMAVFLVMNVFSLYAGYRIAVKYYGDRALRAFVPMAVLAISLMVLNAFVLGQPMSMRHHH